MAVISLQGSGVMLLLASAQAQAWRSMWGDFGFCSRYIGVSRMTFSTLASSTVRFDKCSSAATCAAVI
jgi:hypothetical protein